MNEQMQNFIENKEIIPTPEEIETVLRELIGTEKKYTETKRLEDDNGLYYLDVEIPGEQPGEMIEYGYQRKGRFGMDQSSVTCITVTYYQDGIPISGTTAAELIDGTWKIL